MVSGISWNHREGYSTEGGRGLQRGGGGVRETRDWREKHDKQDEWDEASSECWVLSYLTFSLAHRHRPPKVNQPLTSQLKIEDVQAGWKGSR